MNPQLTTSKQIEIAMARYDLLEELIRDKDLDEVRNVDAILSDGTVIGELLVEFAALELYILELEERQANEAEAAERRRFA